KNALVVSDRGINTSNYGEVVRLPITAFTEERRKQLTKEVYKYAEDAKISVRNGRRDSMDLVKKVFKEGEITEDDRYSLEEDLNEITDKYTKMIDEIVENKNKELMSV